MRSPKYLPFLLLILTLGCGGGSGSGVASTPPPTDISFAFGELSGRAAITNPPKTTNSPNVVSTSLTGTFSILKLRELNPSLKETRIAFATNLFGGESIVSTAVDGSDLQRLTTPPAQNFDTQPAFSAIGKAAFTRNDNVVSSVFLMNADGSGATSHAGGEGEPSYDLAGDKILYNGSSGLKVETVATHAIANIAIPPNSAPQICVLSPDGKTVYESVNTGNMGLNLSLWSAPANGTGSATQILASIPPDPRSLAVSPDNRQLAFTDVANQNVNLVSIGSHEVQSFFVPDITDNNGLSFSPDGKEIAFVDQDGLLSILYLDNDSESHFPASVGSCTTPCWIPFTPDRTLIASSGGILGTHACGVIYNQDGKTTTSVVAFDATTPSSVVMTAQTTANSTSPNLVFSIDADNIIKLAYANGYAWRGIRAIGTGTPVTSANGALVSIDSIDGTVDSILPFGGSRAAGTRPAIRDEGSIRIFTGQFLAVYDKNGKNLAPNGAAQVRLNTKTNALSIG